VREDESCSKCYTGEKVIGRGSFGLFHSTYLTRPSFHTGRPSLYRQPAVCIPRRRELFLRNRSHARWRSSVLAFYLLHCRHSFSQLSSLSSPRKTRLNARRHCSLLCCSTLLRVDLFTRDGHNASVTILLCLGQPFTVSYLHFRCQGP
jgi:hypothetical protein